MNKKWWVSICVLVAMIVPGNTAAFASGNVSTFVPPEITLFYSHTSMISAALVINNSGTADCGGSLTPKSGAYSSTVIIDLQQKKNGESSFKSIKTWSKSRTGHLTVAVDGSMSVTRNAKYRVVTTGKVYTAAGVLGETTTVTSKECSY